MPKKPTITREEIEEGAFRLIREKGYEAFSVRALAAFLGCSTQPVMYHFPDLSVLREIAYQKADEFHSAYLLAGSDLLDLGMKYIRFAAEETMTFRFLFQSGHFSGRSLEEMIRSPETVEILEIIGREAGVSAEEAALFFEPLYAVVHGYASLIANNKIQYDPEMIQRSLTAVAEGLMREER